MPPSFPTHSTESMRHEAPIKAAEAASTPCCWRAAAYSICSSNDSRLLWNRHAHKYVSIIGVLRKMLMENRHEAKFKRRPVHLLECRDSSCRVGDLASSRYSGSGARRLRKSRAQLLVRPNAPQRAF